MNYDYDISGVTEDGRPFINIPEREPTGGGALSNPVFKVSRSVNELLRAGYEVPEVLSVWVANVSAAKKLPPAPVPPSATDPKFLELLDDYVAARGAHAVRVSAVDDLVEAASREMPQVVKDAAAVVLADKKLRGEFEAAAKEYKSCTLALRGVENLAAAAGADLTGEMVRKWHARTAAGERLSRIVDTMKRFLTVLAPLGWDTLQILAMATDRPTQPVANSVAAQIHVPSVCRRWEALVAADRPITLMKSLSDFADRLERAHVYPVEVEK